MRRWTRRYICVGISVILSSILVIYRVLVWVDHHTIDTVHYEPSAVLHHIKMVHYTGSGRLKIGIASCLTSRGAGEERLQLFKISLVEILLLSIINTSESDIYDYTLYLGLDDDDEFWMTKANQERFRALCPRWLRVKFHWFATKPHRIPFNQLMQAVYEDGADYMIRVNDDTEFYTKQWTTLGVYALQQMVPSNVGVVGPISVQGNTEILTHDMVHRTHLHIFNTYYPPVFSNWYVDDWITRVYQPNHCKQIVNWIALHHIEFYGQRYQEIPAEIQHLDFEVSRGKILLQNFLEAQKRMKKPPLS